MSVRHGIHTMIQGSVAEEFNSLWDTWVINSKINSLFWVDYLLKANEFEMTSRYN